MGRVEDPLTRAPAFGTNKHGRSGKYGAVTPLVAHADLANGRTLVCGKSCESLLGLVPQDKLPPTEDLRLS
jgi:hypothetical protein